MIVIKLVGGLASQLHKYAVVMSLAKKYDRDIKVDLTSYENIEENNVMKYGLPNLSLRPTVASNKDIIYSKTPTILGRFLYYLDSKLKKIHFLSKRVKKILNSRKDSVSNIIFKKFLVVHISDNTSLDWIEEVVNSDNCYIQAEFGLRFDIIDNIREELKETIMSSKISTCAKEYLDEINKSRISISMHVRRGDYVTNKHTNSFHGTCGEDYYKSALQKYQNINECKVFVFSDDLEWVEQEFKKFLPKETVFVSGNKDYEDFFLMMNCSNHIIANSGFSSIAAWLSGACESNIISPARWFIHEETNRNQLEILPKGWVYL